MGIDAHMSDLSAVAVSAGNHFSANDDSSAYSGSQRHHGYIFIALSAALPHFSERRHIGVITYRYRHAEGRFHLVSDLLFTPSQIDADVHRAVISHRAGHTDADACKFLLAEFFLFHHSPAGICHILQNIKLLAGPCGDLPFFQKFSFCGKQT